MEDLSLVGVFSTKYPAASRDSSLAKLVRSWPRKCTYYNHKSGWIVFVFKTQEDLNVVLQRGPYYRYAKSLVILKKMPKQFNFCPEQHSIVPLWIQLPNLPLRCWTVNCLSKICTFVGIPCYMDRFTASKKKISFARCLVEVDLTQILPDSVILKFPEEYHVKPIKQHILYEDPPPFCLDCKTIGHSASECTGGNQLPTVNDVPPMSNKIAADDGEKGENMNIHAAMDPNSTSVANAFENSKKSKKKKKNKKKAVVGNGIAAPSDTAGQQEALTFKKSNKKNANCIAAPSGTVEQTSKKDAAIVANDIAALSSDTPKKQKARTSKKGKKKNAVVGNDIVARSF